MTAKETETMILFGTGFVAYFLPGIIALGRGHQNAGAIAVLNALFGWTIVGWIIALLRAVTAITKTTQSNTATLAAIVLLLSLLSASLVTFDSSFGSLVRDRSNAKSTSPNRGEGDRIAARRQSKFGVDFAGSPDTRQSMVHSWITKRD
jgi:hypothetical protein